MTQMTLTKTRLVNGVWEGELTGAGAVAPTLQVSHLGEPVEGLRVEHDAARDAWRVTVPVPAQLISDGVQTFVISDAQGRALGSFALLAGEALAEDIRAEMNLLRAELEMLKKSFRQHCHDS
ncbi:MAG: hypothetical protein AAFP85_04365 [Pseudomonadota bacterium]